MEFLTGTGFAVSKAEIDFVSFLQKSYRQGDNFFHSVTEIANPQYAFTLLFPAFSVLSPRLAAKVLTTAMLSEWVNALLKWLLMGHRPFWWVREYLEHVQPLRTPRLRQTYLTCETGPGNPSGHVMSFASIMLILVYAAIPWLTKRRSNQAQNVISVVIWMLYALSLILVSVSRLYVAAHFPHQCILGAAIGIILGHVVETTSSQWLSGWSRRQLLKATAIIWGSAFGGYWLQRLVGVDPQWSVKLAFKWCNSPEHIHVSTTPIFALTRDCGTALGLALAVTIMPPTRKGSSQVEVLTRAGLQSLGVGAVLWLAHLGRLSVPTQDARIFYVCIMLLNAAVPLLLLVSIPKITNFIGNLLFGTENKKQN